eukprot:6206299-Pleurochrysis_carterae.AAC.3
MKASKVLLRFSSWVRGRYRPTMRMMVYGNASHSGTEVHKAGLRIRQHNEALRFASTVAAA